MNRNMDIITDVRAFNRFYTNILGLLDKHILASGYSLTEARVLFEISRKKHCAANWLASLLEIDRSYMSRIIAKFEKQGLIIRHTSNTDCRVSEIQLTAKGVNVFQELNNRSNDQIEKLFSMLNEEECRKVREAMNTVKKYMTIATANLTIRPFRDTDVEYVIDRQLSLYESERHFTSEVWKQYLSGGVLALVERFDSERDCMLILECKGNPAGCVAVTHTDKDTAQLRYFFLEPELRGLGAGKKLLDMALNFCIEKGYHHVFLWTVSAQEAARNLYAKVGFRLSQTNENMNWGTPVLEERWDMELNTKPIMA